MIFSHSSFHAAREKNNNPVYPVTVIAIEEQEIRMSKNNFLYLFSVKISPVLRLNLVSVCKLTEDLLKSQLGGKKNHDRHMGGFCLNDSSMLLDLHSFRRYITILIIIISSIINLD